MDEILVVAAVVRDDDKYLIGCRPYEKRHGGLWEFPGGKLLHEESISDAIERELREEVGVETTSTGEVLFEARDPDSPFVIRFVEASIAGKPSAIEHVDVAWASIADLVKYPLAPTDARFVAECLLEGGKNV